MNLIQHLTQHLTQVHYGVMRQRVQVALLLFWVLAFGAISVWAVIWGLALSALLLHLIRTQ